MPTPRRTTSSSSQQQRQQWIVKSCLDFKRRRQALKLIFVTIVLLELIFLMTATTKQNEEKSILQQQQQQESLGQPIQLMRHVTNNKKQRLQKEEELQQQRQKKKKLKTSTTPSKHKIKTKLNRQDGTSDSGLVVTPPPRNIIEKGEGEDQEKNMMIRRKTSSTTITHKLYNNEDGTAAAVADSVSQEAKKMKPKTETTNNAISSQIEIPTDVHHESLNTKVETSIHTKTLLEKNDPSSSSSSLTTTTTITKEDIHQTQSLPLPIFVASLPKSVTSSSWEYFKCGGYNTAYQFIDGSQQQRKIGTCFESNVQNGIPPLEGCGNYDVWIDTGAAQKGNNGCYQPAIQGLNAFHDAYPNATLILVTMDPELWYYGLSYVRAFHHLPQCQGFPKKGSTKNDWIEFYNNHTRMVRTFADTHPSITYHEFSSKNPQVASKMEAATGINASCWSIDPTEIKNQELAKQRDKERESTQPVQRMNATNSKIPLPIFVVSLPKSATSSTWVYFNCGGYNAAHHWIKGGARVGECFESNVHNGTPPFEGCGDYNVYTDTGYVDQAPSCYQPEIQGLDAFYEAYPNGTMVLVTREPERWFRSLYKLEFLLLFNKLQHCPGFPNKGSSKDDWLQFYINHTHTVRAFAKAHPSLTYLEYAVEDPKVASKIEADTGVNATCWKVAGKSRTFKHSPKDLSLLTLLNDEEGGIDKKQMKTTEDENENENNNIISEMQNQDSPKTKFIEIETIPNITTQIDHSGSNSSKLPLPIFVASLPKSATTSASEYFQCGGYTAANQWIEGSGKIGECFESNVQNGRPPFAECGNYDVWTDTGYVEKDQGCYQPAVQGLDALYQAYPTGTIILITLDPVLWLNSLSGLRLFHHLHHCPGFPSRGSTNEDWLEFYMNHTRTVRAFAEAHPSMTYHEFSAKNAQVASKMEAATGVNATCWGG